MPADDIGKVSEQTLHHLSKDLIKAIEALPPESLRRYCRLMLETSERAVRERERAIYELVPGIYWLEGVEVAIDFDHPDRKIFVLNLLDWILAQQRRIRILERRIDELTDENLELSWKLDSGNT